MAPHDTNDSNIRDSDSNPVWVSDSCDWRADSRSDHRKEEGEKIEVKFIRPGNGCCPNFETDDAIYYITNFKSYDNCYPYTYSLMYKKKGYWRKPKCSKGFRLFTKAHKMRLHSSTNGVLEYRHLGKYYFYDQYKDCLIIRYIEHEICGGFVSFEDCKRYAIDYLKKFYEKRGL